MRRHALKAGLVSWVTLYTVGAFLFSFPFPQALAQNQQQSQQNAGEKNDTASKMASLVSILSMALGGMTMAAGIQDLATCASSEGTASGSSNGTANSAAAGTQAAQASGTAATNAAGSNGGSTSGGAGAATTAGVAAGYSVKGGNACSTGAMSTLAGGLMLLQGMQGMQGAKAAGENANVAFDNMSNLSSISSSMGKRSSTAGVKIDPSLLRNGSASKVMDDFEKTFGVGRDDFANAMLAGGDPAAFFAAASKGKMSKDEISKAMGKAGALTEEQKAGLLAKTGIGKIQAEATGKMNGDYGMSSGGRSTASATYKSQFDDIKPIDPMSLKPEKLGSENIALSPEVQAALEAKEAEARRNGFSDQTIFQLVHNKYKEKFGMVFGQGVGAKGFDGIADPDGNAMKSK